MFLPGTKIEVIASSATGKGAKLRRGSLGYISSQGSVRAIHNLGLFVMPARLVITRFGNENKRRIEHKWVQFILPQTSVTKHPMRSLNTSIKKSQDANLITKSFFEDEGVQIKKAVSLVALPTTNESDYSEDINELKAWASSLLFSGFLHETLFGMPHTADTIQRTKLQEVLPEMVEKSHELVTHPKALYSLLDNFKEKGDFPALVNTIVWFRTQQMLITRKIFNEVYHIKEPVFLNASKAGSLSWIKYGMGTDVKIRKSGFTESIKAWAELLKSL